MIKIFYTHSTHFPKDLEMQYSDWKKGLETNIDVKNTSLSTDSNMWVLVVVYDIK